MTEPQPTTPAVPADGLTAALDQQRAALQTALSWHSPYSEPKERLVEPLLRAAHAVASSVDATVGTDTDADRLLRQYQVFSEASAAANQGAAGALIAHNLEHVADHLSGIDHSLDLWVADTIARKRWRRRALLGAAVGVGLGVWLSRQPSAATRAAGRTGNLGQRLMERS